MRNSQYVTIAVDAMKFITKIKIVAQHNLNRQFAWFTVEQGIHCDEHTYTMTNQLIVQLQILYYDLENSKFFLSCSWSIVTVLQQVYRQ